MLSINESVYHVYQVYMKFLGTEEGVCHWHFQKNKNKNSQGSKEILLQL